MHLTLLSGLLDLLKSCLSHTSLCFRCSKNLSLWDSYFEYPKHVLWFGKRKMILHHTILSGGLVNVYSIYLQWKVYKPYIICFGCSREFSHWNVPFENPEHMLWFGKRWSGWCLLHLLGSFIPVSRFAMAFCCFPWNLSNFQQIPQKIIKFAVDSIENCRRFYEISNFP